MLIAGELTAGEGQEGQHAPGHGLQELVVAEGRGSLEGIAQALQRLGQALGLAPTGWLDLHEGGGIWLADQATGEPVGLPGNPRSVLEQRFPRLVLPPEVTEAGWWNRDFEKKDERLPRARHRWRQDTPASSARGTPDSRHGPCWPRPNG